MMLKKDTIDDNNTIDQVLKYVDWVCNEWVIILFSDKKWNSLKLFKYSYLMKV